MVALGEIGLDFVDNLWLKLSYEDPELRAIQEQVFRDQLRLAQELELPVIIHSRGAHAAVTRILREEGMEAVGGCVQFLDGIAGDVERYVALDFTFSVGSSVTYPDRAEDWHDTVRSMPRRARCCSRPTPRGCPTSAASPRAACPPTSMPVGETVAQMRGIEPEEVFSLTTVEPCERCRASDDALTSPTT